MNAFPRIATVNQQFKAPSLDSIAKALKKQASCHSGLLTALSNKRIAVAVGSRGISRIDKIVQGVVAHLKSVGAHPIVVPAMGSHGGSTSKGQAKILAGYGVTEDVVDAPIISSTESVEIGSTADGVAVHTDRVAFESDGIVLINRIKPHTDFKGKVESGLMKMIAVGLGNIEGANTFHQSAAIRGYEHLILTKGRVLINSGKLIMGVALIENAYHETAHLEFIPAATLEKREQELLVTAKKLMPSLPFEKLDILVIDRIGKELSGSGMDPNITGRWFKLNSVWQDKPDIMRIVVLDLTEASGGNAIGIGLADFCSGRVVEKIDHRVTYLNAITSRNLFPGHIPLHFPTDQETLGQAFASLAGNRTPREIRLARIRDTLNLTTIEASEALLTELEENPAVSHISQLHNMTFSPEGSLHPIQERRTANE
jgi:hypothetical protein